MSIKKQSLQSLADGILKFENSKNIVKNSDFSDFKQFLKKYLNTPEPRQRKKLAEKENRQLSNLFEIIEDGVKNDI